MKILIYQANNLIGGEFRTTTSNDPIPMVNPCIEQVLWTQPSSDETHGAEALDHARVTLKTWSDVHGWERGRILRAIAGEMRCARSR